MKFNLEISNTAKAQIELTPEEFIQSLSIIKEMQSEIISNPDSVSVVLNSYAAAINKVITVPEVRR